MLINEKKYIIIFNNIIRKINCKTKEMKLLFMNQEKKWINS